MDDGRFTKAVVRVRHLHDEARRSSRWSSQSERRKVFAAIEEQYTTLLTDAPHHPALLGGLGTLLVETGRGDLGVSFLLQATHHDPHDPAHWNALGAAYRSMDMPAEAREALGRSLALARHDDDRVRLMHNMAATHIGEGEPDEAIAWAHRALALDPSDEAVLFTLGMAQLERGEYGEGWDNCDRGGRIAVARPRDYSSSSRQVERWDGSAGKRVVVFGEQGLGDEVMFAHAIPDLIAVSRSVVIECHPRLESIFRRSFPQAEAVYGTRTKRHVEWPHDHQLDCYVASGSLHRYFRRTSKDFPSYPDGYLVPDPRRVDAFRARRRRCRVGISWRGGTRQTHSRRRSMALETLAPILSVQGVDFVSLQYTTDAADEVRAGRERFGWAIDHDDGMNADLDSVFACMKSLDLVISVVTSNVQFAGSMNVPTWVLVPPKVSWQYTGTTMPWFPSTTIYRQDSRRAWDGVLVRVADDLQSMLHAPGSPG